MIGFISLILPFKWFSLFFATVKSEKEIGLTKWCQLCNIRKENILFIGDSNSDIEIARNVGFGCAEGNASSGLKSAAKFTANNSYGDGVIEIIKHYLNKDSA